MKIAFIIVGGLLFAIIVSALLNWIIQYLRKKNSEGHYGD